MCGSCSTGGSIRRLAPAPRIAKKTLTPVIRHLRGLGLRVAVYLNDILCLSRSRHESILHTHILVDTLHHFGFGTQPEEIELYPCHSIKFLGTWVNSKLM